MAEAIIFPDVVAAYVAYLSPLLGVEVVGRVPADRPAEFVRVKRVGGGRRDLVTDSPVVVFEAWADTDAKAAQLALRTRAYVYASEQEFLGEAWIRSVTDVSGLVDSPDPRSESPRYLYTAQIDVKGGAL